MVGDNEYASFGAHFYCAQNILCGSSLPIVEKECTALALKMVSELDSDHYFPVCDNNSTH